MDKGQPMSAVLAGSKEVKREEAHPSLALSV